MFKKLILCSILTSSCYLSGCGDDDGVLAFSDQSQMRVSLQWPLSNKTHIWLESADLVINGDGMTEPIKQEFKHLHYREDEHLDFQLPYGYKTVQIELKNKDGLVMVTKSTSVNLKAGRTDQVRFKIRTITQAELKRIAEEKERAQNPPEDIIDHNQPIYMRAFLYVKKYIQGWIQPAPKIKTTPESALE